MIAFAIRNTRIERKANLGCGLVWKQDSGIGFARAGKGSKNGAKASAPVSISVGPPPSLPSGRSPNKLVGRYLQCATCLVDANKNRCSSDAAQRVACLGPKSLKRVFTSTRRVYYCESPANGNPVSSAIGFFQVVRSFVLNCFKCECPHARASTCINSVDDLKKRASRSAEF